MYFFERDSAGLRCRRVNIDSGDVLESIAMFEIPETVFVLVDGFGGHEGHSLRYYRTVIFEDKFYGLENKINDA